MRTFTRLAMLIIVFAVTGCASYPVTATVVTNPGKRVTAEAPRVNVLWLSPLPMETSSLLIDDLIEQCGGADLTGVTIGTEIGWVIIGSSEKIVATGYCVESATD